MTLQSANPVPNNTRAMFNKKVVFKEEWVGCMGPVRPTRKVPRIQQRLDRGVQIGWIEPPTPGLSILFPRGGWRGATGDSIVLQSAEDLEANVVKLSIIERRRCYSGREQRCR